MKIKTLIKLTATVALTFGFVAANAAYPVGDVVNGAPVKLNVNGEISANQAINCYLSSKAANKVNQENAFYGCVNDMAKTNKQTTKDVEAKNIGLVDSIKHAQKTGKSYTSKQYDKYSRMANVMMFANANSQENISLTKQLAQSAKSFPFYTKLDIISSMSFKIINSIKEQATNQAILTTLLAISDSLNQIKNDLKSNAFVTGNCTVNKLTQKKVLSKLSPDELRAMALGILDGLSNSKSGGNLPIFEGTQIPKKQ